MSAFLFKDSTIKCLSLFSAFILGMGAGPLWVSVSYHIAACANEENKGIYTGLFFTLYNTSYLATNILASFLIENAKKSTFYWIMTMLAVIGSSFFIFVDHPNSQKNISLIDVQNDEKYLENETKSTSIFEIKSSSKSFINN